MDAQISKSEFPLISVVVPARNEAEDIAATLDAILGIDYEPKEIIVVDDSTDETPEIVSQYADYGVRLIHREQNSNGCCGARNLGMQMARGEIVVLMNADNRPRPDFLRRLLVNYQNGADYVTVRSVVLNQDTKYGRFAHASAMVSRRTNPVSKHEWSEGFSCRRAAAEAVGYIPGDFPVPFCRDWRVGRALNRAGFRKCVDQSIPMEHIVPDRLDSYWRNQVWRGTFSAPYTYYFRGMSIPKIALRETLKALRSLARYLLVLPAIWRCIRLSGYAPRGWRDIPGLFVVGLVQDAATTVGNFKGLYRVMQVEGVRNKYQETLNRR